MFNALAAAVSPSHSLRNSLSRSSGPTSRLPRVIGFPKRW
jgi:hypothetical protein